MTRLVLVRGGSGGTGPARTVLHPTAALSRRAGITPVTVPAGMWVSPSLVHAMKAPRKLRAVA